MLVIEFRFHCISGMTAALEAAEVGKQVIVIEKTPSVGGRVTRLYKYFPKLCFPTCGLEINQRRMAANKNITVLTMAEVTVMIGLNLLPVTKSMAKHFACMKSATSRNTTIAGFISDRFNFYST